jgi:hypothetical protein
VGSCLSFCGVEGFPLLIKDHNWEQHNLGKRTDNRTWSSGEATHDLNDPDATARAKRLWVA